MDKLQSSFNETLRKELDQLVQLEAVLGLELEALKQRDIDAVSKNSENKQRLISSIEALGRDRLGFLKGAGIDTDKVSIQSYIDADASGELRRSWDELEAVLRRCQKQNQVNGMLLEKGRQQTQQLLGILLGEGDEAQGTGLYDAKGSTNSSFSNGRSVKV